MTSNGGITRLNWGYQLGNSLLTYRMREPNSAKHPESHAGVSGNFLPRKEDNGREAEPGDATVECALMAATS